MCLNKVKIISIVYIKIDIVFENCGDSIEILRLIIFCMLRNVPSTFPRFLPNPYSFHQNLFFFWTALIMIIVLNTICMNSYDIYIYYSSIYQTLRKENIEFWQIWLIEIEHFYLFKNTINKNMNNMRNTWYTIYEYISFFCMCVYGIFYCS